MDNETIEKIKKFMEAQGEAEKRGEYEFVCPLCGGNARWARSVHNNHLHCQCGKCGMLMME